MDLEHRAHVPSALTVRQRQVADLVTQYVRGAGEFPSAGWLARRLFVSRQTAREHLQTLRRKQWFGPYRDRR